MLLPVALLVMADFMGRDRDLKDWTASLRAGVKYPLYALFIAAILIFSAKGISTDFIYSAF